MRTIPALGVVLVACTAATPAIHDEAVHGPPALIGPVTCFAVLDGDVLACSQAGIARLDRPRAWTSVRAHGARPWCDPGFRVVALTVVAPAVFACGGIPGETGVVARIIDGRVVARRLVAEDLVSCIAAATDTILCGCDDGRVLELDAATLEPRRELRRHASAVSALALSGDLLASTALDGSVMIGPWGRDPRVLRDHTAGVACAVWSDSGTVLASGSRDGRVRFHDRDGRLLASTEPLRERVLCIAALEDGRFVFGTDGGRLLETATNLHEPPALLSFDGPPVHALRVHDGATLVGRRGAVERCQAPNHRSEPRPTGLTRKPAKLPDRNTPAPLAPSPVDLIVPLDAPSASSFAAILRAVNVPVLSACSSALSIVLGGSACSSSPKSGSRST